LDPSNHHRNELGIGAAGGGDRLRQANGTPGQDDSWLRSVVEHSSEIVTVIDPDGTLRYANPAFGRVLGYDPGEAAGTMNVLDHVHPDDLPHVLEEIEEALAEGGVASNRAEYRFRQADGSWRWMESVGTYLLDDPAAGVVVITFRDVTERKEAVHRSEERLRSLADSAFEGILLTDAGEILEANRALIDMFGYGTAELVGRSALEFVAPEHRDLVRRNIASGAEDPYEIVGVRKDGTRLDLEVRGRAYSYRGRDVRVTAVRDVTERKRAEGRLREAEERYRTLVEQIPAVTYIDPVDDPDTSLYTSPHIERMLGYTPEEWKAGKLWPKRLHPDDRERVLAADERFEAGGEERFSEEYRLLAKDGSVVWVREDAVVVKDDEGKPLYWQGIMSDVTQKKRSEERLHHLAFHDPLTGLPNRRLFEDHLGHALKLTRRQGNRVAVLFLDLDQFKVVNDSLGHEVGDLLLTVVAQRLGRCLRPEDTLARFGGDEFVVLLEAVDDPAEAVRVAERITEELRRPFVLEERQLYAAASIGVSVGHARTHGPEGLLREADTAMYRAKAEGSGYEVFDPAMHERALGRLELENDLRRAIEEDEFVVHYQPIVNLQTGELWGMEALVRWGHPERGLLNPDEFVPVAEESGLVVPMGERVLEEACRRAVEWQREFPSNPPLAMSVNLSARQLRRPDLHEAIGRVLAETGLPASSLGLDITETVYIGALEANTAALDRLRALGIRVSLDDFGSGYSSLSYLKRLPTDILKIDRSFTKGLGLEAEDTAIVQTVVDLAHILGMEVVAEGVEVEEQETLLREMGCDFGQGYHFSKPLPPEAASAFLRSALRGLAQGNDADS
jgi:diguanylate cyclase (GGDEF)-like protein/PAS domain S-box-containing protein